MHYITDTLYWISTGLLVPVVVLLIYFFIRSLILIGGWFGQYLDVRRLQARLLPLITPLTAQTVRNLSQSLPTSRLPLVDTLGKMLAETDAARIEKLLADYEIMADRDMSLAKTLSKMGPMLGLMGTLIPMGPALVGLSTGDIASMAYNMQVAFATTVIGLFSAAVGFVVLQSKQRWYAADMNTLEFVASLLNDKNIQA
ncbi:MAG: MotA/TolQ/ExbB proton channel family protein [Bacteroidales bacterium]|nr:MotA/TolQ/ExbB proton channel family protein [Bacteroidales bacterium]